MLAWQVCDFGMLTPRAMIEVLQEFGHGRLWAILQSTTSFGHSSCAQNLDHGQTTVDGVDDDAVKVKSKLVRPMSSLEQPGLSAT